MTNKEKIIVVAMMDEVLHEVFGIDDLFNENEKNELVSMIRTVFDSTAPNELRRSLKETARKFYDELDAKGLDSL